MTVTSIAGQIATRLESALQQAGRRRGLASMPGPTARCFFEDPLGDVLGDDAPLCPPDGSRPWNLQPLWSALATGYHEVPGTGSRLHLYQIIGNGTGTAAERSRYLARAHQWTFMHFLHWYQRPTERYETFRNVVLMATTRQVAPCRRVWQGYETAVRTLLIRTTGDAAHPLLNVESTEPSPPTKTFSDEPAWIDALSRLATSHVAARDHVTAAAFLDGERIVRTAANWAWDAAPATSPNTLTLNQHRCSPNTYSYLARAMRLDRFLAIEQAMSLDHWPGAPASAPEKSVDESDLLARNRLVDELSRNLDATSGLSGGSMRFAGAGGDERTPNPRPAEAASVPVERSDTRPGSRPWDPNPKLLSRQLDPNDPDHFCMSVVHEDLIDQFADPDLGVMVHVEVRTAQGLHRSFALSHDYVPPTPDSRTGLGTLHLELDSGAAMPFFGTGMKAVSPGLSGWSWRVRSAIAITGEPVVLLRIDA